jgi:chromosome segregation ATPase
MTDHERDIPTEALARAAAAGAEAALERHASRASIPAQMHEGHECHQEDRLDQMDEDLDDHETRIRVCEASLADGRTNFAEIRKDIGALTEKVGNLVSGVWWLVGAIIVAALGIVASIATKLLGG